MKIGILGSGNVGQTLGKALAKQGHDVMIGTRDKQKLAEWQKDAGNHAHVGSFFEAAKFGDAIFVATLWSGTMNALELAGKEQFLGKIVIDVTNPLDFSKTPPGLATTYPVSGAEMIKNYLGDVKVVKAFNTVPAHVMVNPDFNGTKADLFIAGHDRAKSFVKDIAKSLGWNSVVDMGDLGSAYWVEMLGMVSVTYGFAHNDWNFAYKFLRK